MAYPTAPAYTYAGYSPKTKNALPSLPTGTVSGSRLLLLVAMEVDKAEDEVTATLSGAKEVGKHARVLEGNAQAFELEYKGSAFPEITFSRSCEGGLILIRLEGEGAITAGSGWTSKTASSTVEAAAMTPSAEALVLACFFNDGGFHYSEPSSGWSSVAEGEFFFAVLGKDVKAGESSGVGSAKMGGSRAYLTFTVGIEAGVSPVTLPLSAAPAASSGSLQITAPPKLPLAGASAASGATLGLSVPPKLPLGPATDTSAATLGLTVPPKLPLSSASAASGAALALSASPKLPLAAAGDISSASLALTVPSSVALHPSAAGATSNASLALSVPSAGQRYDLGQGVDVTVRLEVLNGVWETCGAGRALEVLPESVSFGANEWGPDKASFTLRRNPWGVWPDLLAFTPVEIEVGGVVCWEGRTGETPIKAGAEQQINVQAEGWQYHLDDDVYKRMYVHSTLSDWKDVRSNPDANLAGWAAAPQVQAESGAIVLTIPKGTTVGPSSEEPAVGVFLELPDYAKYVVVRGEATGPDGYGTEVFVRAGANVNEGTAVSKVGIILDGSGAPLGFNMAAEVTGSPAFLVIYAGVITSELVDVAEDVTWRLRIVEVFTECTTDGWGTDSNEIAIELKAGDAYGSSEGSQLNASIVAQDAIERATLLLSKDYTQINAAHDDVFPIPSLVMSSFQTPRQMIEAVNAYNNWTAMIDTQRRLVYQKRPAEPLLEFGAWSGEESEDTSAGEGSEIFNRVIVEGTNAEGVPVSYVYLATQFALEEGKEPEEPRWKSEFGSRFEVSGTSTESATKPTEGDAQAGTSYLLRAQGKINGSGAGTGGPSRPHRLEVIWLGATATLNFAAATEEAFELVVGVPALAAPVVEPPIEVRLTNFTQAGTATAQIEHITITAKEPTLVDQRSFSRTKTIQVSNVLTEALAQKLAQTYLDGHADTPYGGSLTAKVGSVRRLLGGQRVHPSLLCQSVQELIRVSHAIDPDTGGVGRDGRIAAVEYTHADQSATVTLNSRLQNFEALMARLAIVEEAGS